MISATAVDRHDRGFRLLRNTLTRFVRTGVNFALVLDATVVRMIPVPAALKLMDNAARRVPRPLRQLRQRAASPPVRPRTRTGNRAVTSTYDSGGKMTAVVQEVVVYTRPGCPFCTSLRAGLRRQGLAFTEVDIWEDPEAAAVVRSIADGNETVPTVVVGDWQAVNPSATSVLSAVGEHAPHLLPERQPGPVDGVLKALGLRKVRD
jgi:glutaredoxin-like protein